MVDWYAYFFEPSRTKQSVIVRDLPPFLDARVIITITGSGTVHIGHCAVGTVYALGDTQYGATAGIRDYSRKTTDEATGLVTLERRKFAKILRARFSVPEAAITALSTLLTDLRATPCVWLADNDTGLEPLILFGWYRDWELDVAYPGASHYSLELEGMT